jgi:ABC-type Zn uptake system ZnuABC Zn-binding protein ZnuA
MLRCVKYLVWAALQLSLAGIFAFSGCGTAPDPWKGVPGGPTRVVTSFAPLFCFAKNVAGQDAAVLSLLTTTGPHDYQTGSHDVVLLRTANLFLANGLGLDDKVIDSVRKSGNADLKIIRLGKAIPQKNLLALGEHEEHEPKDGHEHEHHDGFDPHVWLGIPEAIMMVERIRDVLKKQDPSHVDGFEKRAAAHVGQLRELHNHGKKALAGKKNRKIIAQHESLGYFARSFGLEVEGAIQLQPGVEPDSAKLAQLVQLCKKEKIRVIAVEPQYSKAGAETLARQLQAHKLTVHLVVVDPLETADPPLDPGLYLRKMRENIEVLAKHLE